MSISVTDGLTARSACSGAFARDSHHLMAYDRKNVDFGEVDVGPSKSMASIIYPNDPKRRDLVPGIIGPRNVV